MARRVMSEAAKNARVAKMKATKEKNKQAALEQLGIGPRKKLRKTRNLTPEQKQAARERLAKAREARQSEGPSTNSMYAESVRNLPDEDPLSLANVKQWIVHNKKTLAGIRKETADYYRVSAYITNLEHYLRTGVYSDLRFGLEGDNKIKYRCVAMAYYPDGTPKRSIGVVYPDVGEYTEEMAEADNDRRQAILNKGKVRKAN